MAKMLSYTDAVRILGEGPESDLLRRLDDLTGGFLLGAAVTTPAVLALFDAQARFARLSQQMARSAGRRLTGAHQMSRTDRISAAHTVIVIAAYFETLARAGLPFDLADAKLTADDQIRLAGGVLHRERLAETALRVAVRLPEPHAFRQDYLAGLLGTYRTLSGAAGAFLRGLAVWDGLGPHHEAEVDRLLEQVPARACDRYEELLFDLQADCAEAALWVRDRDTAVLLSSAFEMRDLIRRVAAPAVAADLPDTLRRVYGRLRDRPMMESGELPADLGVPTLGRGYVASLFRVREADPELPASEERTWAGLPVRADLDEFLAGFLTSPRARRAPLLVLGQPGAGKSVLTKVLAAELGEGGFLPIRVPLRDVDTSLDLQRQIEQAVHAATTEAVSWPRLAESAGGRFTVVLLDGFDELIQATAVNRTDYLYRVADFQQREADLGRAVAFLVTTRTSVAEHAAPPPETLLLRLEPFDAERVSRWLGTWSEVNSGHLATRGLRALPAEVALRFADLAGQPLLLLLLALYDAEDNALQHTGSLSQSQLYERLLVSFARREVRKSGPALSEQQRGRDAELELRRLSVVAFAMLNRSAQWVTDRDLEADLTAIFGSPARDAGGDAVNAAALLLGRFFFVHRAQTVRGRNTLQTYEFLHATFGEYLVARYTWQLLREAVARASVTVSADRHTDDGLLARLLSFVPLVARASTVRFLAEMAERLDDQERRQWTESVIGMYRRGDHHTWTAQAGDYRPTRLNMPARYAAYSANLMVLAVVTSGGITFGDLSGPSSRAPARRWHDRALLWHSQLNDAGWGGLWRTITVTACRDSTGAADVRLTLDDGTSTIAPLDPWWLLNEPERRSSGVFAISGATMSVENYRRFVRFQSGENENMVYQSIAPLFESPLGMHFGTFHRAGPDDETHFALQALLRVWLLPVGEAGGQESAAAYRDCVDIATSPVLSGRAQVAYLRLLLRALETDRVIPAAVALEVLRRLRPSCEGDQLSGWYAATHETVLGRMHAD